MRNPVGPLPSSIYWRRRAVVLCLVALIAVLVVWAVTSGGGGGGDGKGSAGPTGSHTPAATITAGPAPSGTHISGRPGGRGTPPADGSSSDGGAGDNGGTGDGTSAGAGDPTDGAASAGSDGTGSSGGPSAGTSGGSTAGSSGGSGGAPLPAGSPLPDCAPSTVSLTLASGQNEYAVGQNPAFQLRAVNSGSVACKVNFGADNAVFTVTKAADSSHVWASDDCPASRSPYLLQVPAHSFTTYTLRWDGKSSSAQCAKPKGQVAAPGTYLVQAQLPGYPAKQTSFVLSQD